MVPPRRRRCGSHCGSTFQLRKCLEAAEELQLLVVAAAGDGGEGPGQAEQLHAHQVRLQLVPHAVGAAAAMPPSPAVYVPSMTEKAVAPLTFTTRLPPNCSAK